jgi:hypothetical protein
MKDVSVLMDFFSNSFARDDIEKLPLTLDHSIMILPLALQLINAKYGPYIKTGLKAGTNILKTFYEVFRH